MDLPRSGSSEWERRAVGRSTERARLRSVDRAQRIVGAVRELASQRRAADVTMSEVAAAAGVPLRSLYRQFPSRDDLLLALLEEEAHVGAAMLGEEMDRASATPATHLQVFVVSLWDFMVKRSGYAAVLVREHLRLAERRPCETRTCLEPLVTLMAEVMNEADIPLDLRAGDASGDAFVLFSVLLAQMQAVLVFLPEAGQVQAAEGVWRLFGAMVGAPDVVQRTDVSP